MLIMAVAVGKLVGVAIHLLWQVEEDIVQRAILTLAD